jgi:hypothetical protein
MPTDPTDPPSSTSPPASRRSGRIKAANKRTHDEMLAGVDTNDGWISENHRTGNEHTVRSTGFSTVRKEIKEGLDAQLSSSTPVGAPVQICGAAQRVHDKGTTENVDIVEHVADDKGRTVLAYGRVHGSHRAGKSDKTPDPPNNSRITGIDDRGHLVAEDAVGSSAANKTGNIIAENSVINQQYKTAFEEHAKNYAEEHPTEHVYTLHQPVYKGDELRPERVNHFLVADGKIKTSLTLENPDDVKFPGR